MKVLITGAKGQLGQCIRRSVEALNESKNCYVFTDVEELDITDSEAITQIVEAEKISLIVNCAAYTNVDKAESDVVMAEKLNAEAPAMLAEAMKRVGGALIHISTDYVFGGECHNTPIAENETPCPTGVYGLTKLHGEILIKESGVKSIIIRTSWLYSEFGKNFVKTMLGLTASKPELKVVFDQCGTPTYAQDLADAIVSIIENNQLKANEGVYHFSNEGVTSWYDFARMIADTAGDRSCNIVPCHSSEFPSSVKRPAYSVLDKTKFKQTFRVEIPFWIDSLRKCINNCSSLI